MTKIREVAWETGTSENIQRDLLSSKETEYLRSYRELLTDYFAAIDLDLTTNIEVSFPYTIFLFYLNIYASEQPPKDLFIQIRALQNCGTIMTDSGPVSLTKGLTVSLKR